MGNLFDIEEQFSFYVNIAIHLIGVPTIFFTSLILAHNLNNTAFASFDLPLPAILGSGPYLPLDFTISLVVACAYALYFVALDPVAGLIYSPWLVALGHLSNVVFDTIPQATTVASYTWTLAWIAQFIGHGKFEGRAPALFTNLIQALVLAVFFVFLEVAFYFGYRPELHKRVQNNIGRRVSEYRRSKAEAGRAKKTT